MVDDKINLAPSQEMALPFTALEIRKLRELLKLLQFVELDAPGNSLVIRNRKGNARLVFKEDGTLRAEGVRVVTAADETLLLDAAVIALN